MMCLKVPLGTLPVARELSFALLRPIEVIYTSIAPWCRARQPADNIPALLPWLFHPAWQIAIRTSMEHAGSLKEIHFLLFGDDAWDAWVAACEDLLGDNIIVEDE